MLASALTRDPRLRPLLRAQDAEENCVPVYLGRDDVDLVIEAAFLLGMAAAAGDDTVGLRDALAAAVERLEPALREHEEA